MMTAMIPIKRTPATADCCTFLWIAQIFHEIMAGKAVDELD